VSVELLLFMFELFMLDVVSVVEGLELFVDDFDELQLMITVVATAVKITNIRFIGFVFLLLNFELNDI
jgi:hypothetical protein